jgi:hypothetical protein
MTSIVVIINNDFVARIRCYATNFLTAITAGSAIPVAISNPFWPGLISANSTSLSFVFCTAISNVFDHSFQPGAELFQL